MLGKMDPKKMQDLMRKLNIDVEEIPAEEVIIKCKDKNIIISQPEVMLAEMMGKDVYQITGTVSESTRPSEHDIEMVMRKTGMGREEVVKALEDLDNDLAAAILELKKRK
jgi:nascent polypeptide-associated complex subunit alpha